MKETVVFGQGDQLVQIPREMWEQHLASVPGECQKLLKFMSEDHYHTGRPFQFFITAQL